MDQVNWTTRNWFNYSRNVLGLVSSWVHNVRI